MDGQRYAARMTTAKRELESAIEVFVHGYSTDKSRTFPYEAIRVGPLWLMRDAVRKNPRDYPARNGSSTTLPSRKPTRSCGGMRGRVSPFPS